MLILLTHINFYVVMFATCTFLLCHHVGGHAVDVGMWEKHPGKNRDSETLTLGSFTATMFCHHLTGPGSRCASLIYKILSL